jgi:YHS domain-containing protein
MVRLLGYLFDLLIAVLVGRLLSRALPQVFGTPRQGSANPGRPGAPRAPETRGGQMARDPVCGMFVSTELSRRLNQDGVTLHFCSEECLERYQKAEARR